MICRRREQAPSRIHRGQECCRFLLTCLVVRSVSRGPTTGRNQVSPASNSLKTLTVGSVTRIRGNEKRSRGSFFSRTYRRLWSANQIWSGKRGSNSRPPPWQGGALPTELFPHFLASCIFYSIISCLAFSRFDFRCTGLPEHRYSKYRLHIIHRHLLTCLAASTRKCSLAVHFFSPPHLVVCEVLFLQRRKKF